MTSFLAKSALFALTATNLIGCADPAAKADKEFAQRSDAVVNAIAKDASQVAIHLATVPDEMEANTFSTIGRDLYMDNVVVKLDTAANTLEFGMPHNGEVKQILHFQYK